MNPEDLCAQHPLTVIDVFCGAGGLSLGFHNAGFNVLMGIDNDPHAIATHKNNFPGQAFLADLTKVQSIPRFIKENQIPTPTVLVGGPPCQGFSPVGKGKLRSLERSVEKDPRNKLYIKFRSLIKHLRPAFFVMENVPGMQSHKTRGKKWRSFAHKVEKSLSINGVYKVEHRVLNAADFGVPQTRRRLFFVGNRLGLPVEWPQPITSAERVTLRDAIGDLPQVPINHKKEEVAYNCSTPTKYQQLMRRNMTGDKAGKLFDHLVRAHRAEDPIVFGMLEPGQAFKDIYKRVVEGGFACAKYGIEKDNKPRFADKYKKLVFSEPSWTLTAHLAKDGYRFIHPDREQGRTISVREAARIQSFPDNFRFSGSMVHQFRQVGNAVPPLLTQAIAGGIKNQIEQYRLAKQAAKAAAAEVPQQQALAA